MFFPSQWFLKYTAKRANITINYAESLKNGILISERIDKTRFSSGRMIYLLDDGTLYSRYFNQSISIKGISGNLVWTSASGGLSFVLPDFKKGLKIEDAVAQCGVIPIKIEIDTLGYLRVTTENGEVIPCNPKYGKRISPFAKEESFTYGSTPVELVEKNKINYLLFGKDTVSERLLDARFAEIITRQGNRRNIFIEEEPFVEFQTSLTPASPRYLGRYTAEGKRWQRQLGNGKTTITQVYRYFLGGKQLIILGYNQQKKTCAVAIDIETGNIRWEKNLE